MPENAANIRMMKLYEILCRETDESHPITRMELSEKAKEHGIACHDRTISRDVAVLNEAGYEVCSIIKDHKRYYYVPERDFTVPELKIMMDAVQAANFVTEKKTKELIDRIAALGGSYRGNLLKRNMAYFNSRKHSNEAILYSVDAIEDAILRKKKIEFYYFDLDEDKIRVYRCDETGERKHYRVEPVALILSEDNYYLMAYSDRHPESTATYRVDRMDIVQVVEDSELSEEALAHLPGVSDYTEQVFRMHNGEPTTVVLRFGKGLLGPVYDKFSEKTEIQSVNDTECEATLSVRVSKTFYGWLAQFGSDIKIVKPKEVAEMYYGHLRAILDSLSEKY